MLVELALRETCQVAMPKYPGDKVKALMARVEILMTAPPTRLVLYGLLASWETTGLCLSGLRTMGAARMGMYASLRPDLRYAGWRKAC